MTWENLLNPVTQENKDLDFLDDVNISDNQDKEFLKTAQSDSLSLGFPQRIPY